MDADDSEAGGEGGDDDGSDAGEEEDADGENDESDQELAVFEGAAEENEGLIGGAEEVEEDPRGEEREE